MIDWQFYPETQPLPEHLVAVVSVLETAAATIGSKSAQLSSNKALSAIAESLTKLGFNVETGAKHAQKIRVPVQFGRRGRAAKTFEVDGYSDATRTVVEIEAGRAVANNQFLKDLFEASVMPSVDYLVIAVRLDYRGGKDFEHVCAFLSSLYRSDRLKLPLKGVLIIGY
jgi:hypothetical protein